MKKLLIIIITRFCMKGKSKNFFRVWFLHPSQAGIKGGYRKQKKRNILALLCASTQKECKKKPPWRWGGRMQLSFRQTSKQEAKFLLIETQSRRWIAKDVPFCCCNTAFPLSSSIQKRVSALASSLLNERESGKRSFWFIFMLWMSAIDLLRVI